MKGLDYHKYHGYRVVALEHNMIKCVLRMTTQSVLNNMDLREAGRKVRQFEP